MSIGSIFSIREPVLRWLLYAMGSFLMVVAGAILVMHEWQAGESRLILLVPFLAGAILVAISAVLRAMAMRIALLLYLVIPAVFMLAVRMGCTGGLLGGGLCV